MIIPEKKMRTPECMKKESMYFAKQCIAVFQLVLRAFDRSFHTAGAERAAYAFRYQFRGPEDDCPLGFCN